MAFIPTRNILPKPPKPIFPTTNYNLVTVKCKYCGAKNSFKTKFTKCEYCKNIIYRK